MTNCNIDQMTRFSCDELRVKRTRAISNIAADQRDKRRLEAEIRQIGIQIAHKEAEIERIKNRPVFPVLPGRSDQNDRRKPGRPGRPGIFGVVGDVAQGAAEPVQGRFEVRELEGEIRGLERRRADRRRRLWNRQERLNEAIASRQCINDAMREKGCIGA